MTEANTIRPQVRPMVAADLGVVLGWRNHPEVRRHMYTQHVITLQEHQHWFEQAVQNPRKHLLIFEENVKALGFVHFTEFASGSIADWGFYAAPDAPKGTGKNLGQAALAHAFTQLNLHKVCAQALAHNEKSIRFHQAIGFAQEGILRDQHFDGDNYQTVICFGLLRTEWQAGQPNTPS